MTNKQLKELVKQNRISEEDAKKLKKPGWIKRGFDYITKLTKFAITLEPPNEDE